MYIDSDFEAHVGIECILVCFRVPFFSFEVTCHVKMVLFRRREGSSGERGNTNDESVLGEVFEEAAGLTAF
jgi:hypothetical protein